VSHHEHPSDLELSRRDALKIAMGVGAAAMIPLVPVEIAEAAQRAVASGKPPALKFFTAAQHRTVDALTEVIIPTDERSPGARAAKVADYLDFVLNESSAEARQSWKDGLTSLDEVSTAQFGKPFADLTGEQQVAIVTDAAKNEGKPTTPLERFFGEAKGRTIHGYYTSEIGIHQELKYKGNQFLPEFVGCDHPEHMS
jgi:gluconate 2-dehydrogenase gamma chain